MLMTLATIIGIKTKSMNKIASEYDEVIAIILLYLATTIRALKCNTNDARRNQNKAYKFVYFRLVVVRPKIHSQFPQFSSSSAPPSSPFGKLA